MAVHLEVEAARFADWRPARVAAPQAGVGRVAVAAARVRPDQQLPAVRLNNIFLTGYRHNLKAKYLHLTVEEPLFSSTYKFG